VASRAWWSLAGGSGRPTANCTLVEELLACLLPPATASGAAVGGLPARTCPLARALGIRGDLTSHYTGVFISVPGSVRMSATARFATAFLEARLAPVCERIGLSTSEPCEPAVLSHDAFSAGVERDPATGAWHVTDPSEPLWAESNWPSEMYTILYPHGKPSTAESLALLGVGLLSAILTYVGVHVSRHQYKVAYKRL